MEMLRVLFVLREELECFGYTNQLVGESDLSNDLVLSENIVIVAGNGLY